MVRPSADGVVARWPSGLARGHAAAEHGSDLLPEARRRLLQPFIDAWQALDWDRLPAGMIYNDANDYNVLVDAAGTRVVSLLDLGDAVH